jgi:hypothetical protein
MDYELGVACRQSAYLYKQLGQLDRAGSDLRKARDSSLRPGQLSEQAEIAREESALNVS